jgi:hypothetical protein
MGGIRNRYGFLPPEKPHVNRKLHRLNGISMVTKYLVDSKEDVPALLFMRMNNYSS